MIAAKVRRPRRDTGPGTGLGRARAILESPPSPTSAAVRNFIKQKTTPSSIASMIRPGASRSVSRLFKQGLQTPARFASVRARAREGGRVRTPSDNISSHPEDILTLLAGSSRVRPNNDAFEWDPSSN